MTVKQKRRLRKSLVKQKKVVQKQSWRKLFVNSGFLNDKKG